VKGFVKQFATFKADAANSAGLHLGVVCDGCNEGPIAGVRFRCNTCKDFDVCGKCFDSPSETLQKHIGDHEFTAMTPDESNSRGSVACGRDESDGGWTEVTPCCKGTSSADCTAGDKSSSCEAPKAEGQPEFNLESIVDLLGNLGVVKDKETAGKLLREFNANKILGAFAQMSKNHQNGGSKPSGDDSKKDEPSSSK